jgi:FkbH-like protein
VTSDTLARVAQLTQKTNQFNLTTKRYSEAELAQRLHDPAWRAYALRASDRFGDHGLVGVALTRDEGEVCEIDTLLMSCRIIGRGIETALLSRIAADCRAVQVRSLRGWFLPTKKNAPAKDFYRLHGFEVLEQRQDSCLFGLDLSRGVIDAPVWIDVRANMAGASAV